VSAALGRRQILFAIASRSGCPYVTPFPSHKLTDTGLAPTSLWPQSSGRITLVNGNGDWATPMAILRYIDAEGREKDVIDVNHLYELIQERSISFDSLI
jgi:hypothetical protein